MTKKFFKTATLIIFGTTALSVLFSYIYLLVGQHLASGEAMLEFLTTLKQIFDYVQLSIGFATVVYAFAKFEFNEALKIFGIFSASILAYTIIFMIPSAIYTAPIYYYFDNFFDEFNKYINLIFYSLGNVLVCQIAPAMVMGAIMWKCTKERKPAPRKFLSWKNPTQKGMIISCLVLAAFNFVVGIFSDYYIFGYLVGQGFRTTFEDFKIIMLNTLSLLLNCIIFNIVLMYLVCFFAYKIYDYISATPSKPKKVKATNEPANLVEGNASVQDIAEIQADKSNISKKQK